MRKWAKIRLGKYAQSKKIGQANMPNLTSQILMADMIEYAASNRYVLQLFKWTSGEWWRMSKWAKIRLGKYTQAKKIGQANMPNLRSQILMADMIECGHQIDIFYSFLNGSLVNGGR